METHIIVFCQYAKFRNAAYEKVHLDLLQNLFKIKLKAHSQLFKKCVDKFCSPSFRAILSRRKNVSNMFLFNYESINRKKPLYIIHFLLCRQPYSIWTITQDLIKLRTYNISNPSLHEVSTFRMKQVASVE